MQLAHQHHIKVVLDGQGADELFGGYHHHFVAQWIMVARANHGRLTWNFRLRQNHLTTLCVLCQEKIKQNIHLNRKNVGMFFNKEFIQMYPVQNPVVYSNP